MTMRKRSIEREKRTYGYSDAQTTGLSLLEVIAEFLSDFVQGFFCHVVVLERREMRNSSGERGEESRPGGSEEDLMHTFLDFC